jgi:diacylglycerol O-acyltransferase / wax synthase
VQRLAGIDANFLYMETPAAHMHTIKVAVVEPAPGIDYSIARVKRDLAERLHLLPPFRRRVVEVPFGFHHPVWIEDPAFDLDWHVRRRAVPAPGGPREMDAVISEIAGVPLDRTRPLWELWILEGLAAGRIAAVAKIHHSLADGVAVAALLANVMAPGLRDLAAAPIDDPWRPEPMPAPARLLRDALRDHRRQVAALPALLRRTVRNVRAAGRVRRATPVKPPRPLVDAPSTSLNGALTPRRAFASTAVPLDEVRVVKTAFGVTLNDVLLCLVGGAVREYLMARNALPARSLIAEVPVATDAPGEQRLAGNRLSNIFTSLCTDVADPGDRVRRIHDVTQTAKRLHDVAGADLYASWTEFAPPRPASWWMRLYSTLRLADRHPPAVNVIVSCVPGPRSGLAWPGGRLDAIYSVGPIIEGAAFNVTAWSYVDRLCIGVLTCPDLVPDPREVVEGLHGALAALLAAVAPPVP